MTQVVVSGSFDHLRSRQVRFLEEACRFGSLHVLLWSDAAALAWEGRAPTFPEAERRYLLEALRYVDQVTLLDPAAGPDVLPAPAGGSPTLWVVDEASDRPARRAWCCAQGVGYYVLKDADLAGFPSAAPRAPASDRKKVLVTGCYDWFHSGHVRFFEECAQLGDLYVVVGHDANLRLLKGEGHPRFPQDERRYMVAAVRHVLDARISTGDGWLDAEPQIRQLRPDLYVVNEDGDKPEKREFCARQGLDYVVLKRTPKEGLPRRESTALRGF